MSVLPPEILQEIVSFHLLSPSTKGRTSLVTVSSSFLDICQKILYTRLRFTSRRQLSSFISTYGTPEHSVPHPPRYLELDITGDHSHLVFADLHALLSRCFSVDREDTERDESGRLCLELIGLRLNSHAFDFRVEMIYDALSLVNPRRFIWTGPDPPHHFSIAIVLQAIPHLFRALASYTNLKHLTLTHLAMSSSWASYELPVIPSLQTLHLGQVIFLNPLVVANFILNSELKSLEKVHLVDAYTESIWGPRLRRSDIELTAMSIDDSTDRLRRLRTPIIGDTGVSKPIQAIIHDIVICEAKTERIIGGDRVEDHARLL